ncbi:putative ribonuclease H-like domain-containing protein [Tanacetum coccineum]
MEQMTSIYDMIPICYDDDEDNTIAVTPVLSVEEPVDSLIMEDEHLDAIPEMESDKVIKSSVEDLIPIPKHSEIVVNFSDDSTSSDDDYPYGEDIDYVDASPPDAEIVSSEVVEIVVPEVGGIDTDILLTIKDDILHEKLLNVNLLIANIEALKDNPTLSSGFVIKSSSTFPNSFLEETNTLDNSLTESETFCFDLEENSSGSTTTPPDYSLPDYEAFYLDDDHIEEKSSGSTTTHADFSKYDSFIFDLSINPFPPADRSDFYHEEFADELAHIISPPEYDCFYFKSEPDPGELTSIVDSRIRENVLSKTNVNLPFEDDQSPLLAYVVWIFLAFLTYPVTPPYLLSCGNEDTIFDPDISVYHSFMPSVSHRSESFMKFNVQKQVMVQVKLERKKEPAKDYILLPLWTPDPPFPQGPKSSQDDGFQPSNADGKKVDEDSRRENECKDQEKENSVNNTNSVNVVSSTVNTNGINELLNDPNMPELEDINIFEDSNKDVGAEANLNNLESTFQVCHVPTTRVHKDHPLCQVIRDVQSAVQTRRMSKNLEEQGFVVYQMDIKSAFLYGKIKEEVYVCQPPGFEDPYFPDKVYKVKKALYGLNQAPRAWQKGDILLVQVYVDDIIFGSTRKELCIKFEKLMHDKFQMSSMGELTFFLGLQVKQKKDGIFISQDKYVAEILKKFGFTEVKTASTPMETQKPLLKDENGEEVDVHMYRSMIGSLMYLTSSRPDIMFAVCTCARYQVNPKVSHLHVVKRIFRYLKGQLKLGLWYPKDSPFDLVAYTDSDYAGASLDKKSTTGGCQFLGCRLISWQCKK